VKALGEVEPGLPLGHTEARIFTPPLVELSPETSYGYDVVDFADRVMGEPLDPWQEWAAIHVGELLPDGRPRFRRVLLLVSRQQGKTHLMKILIEYWLFVEAWPLVFGSSTNLDYAREAWEKVAQDAEDNPALSRLLPADRSRGIRRANGEQTITTVERCRYKIGTASRRGGRSLSLDRIVADELREQHDWSAYNAAYPAMNARPYGQAFFTSNAGDDTSLVLNSMRRDAITFIESGEGDPRLGLMEWSGPDRCAVDDVQALAQANPNVGRRGDWDTLLGAARSAKANGGEEEAGFRTEFLCQHVPVLGEVPVPKESWDECAFPGLDLDEVAGDLAGCVDVSLDLRHATFAVAGLDSEGVVRAAVVGAWSGPDATEQLRTRLGTLVPALELQAFGFFRQGPAAALAVDLEECGAEPIDSVVKPACQGLAEAVRSGLVAHNGCPLLTDHVLGSKKVNMGDGWRLGRRGSGHVDAAYALAGAVHLARTLPPPVRLSIL
jgi:hypothetical protein